MLEGWEEVRLGDIMSFRSESGGTESGDLYITTENMRPDVGGIDFDREVNVPKKAKRFYVGDVLFSNLRPYFKKVFLAEDDGFCSSDVLVFRSDLESALLFYIISSDHFINTVSANMKGTRMPRGDKDTIVNYLIQVPKNVKEQEEIVEALSGLDAVIDGVRGVLEKAEVVERGLYQRVFAERDGWEEVRLGEVIDITTGKINANQADENGSYPFYTCGRETLRINTTAFDGESILLAGNGDFGLKYHRDGKFNAYQRTYVIRSTDQSTLLNTYLFRILKRKVHTLVSQGGVIKFLRLPQIVGLKMTLPPLKKQKEIVEVFEAHEAYVRGYEEYLEKLERVKKALMQKLLSGEVRVRI